MSALDAATVGAAVAIILLTLNTYKAGIGSINLIPFRELAEGDFRLAMFDLVGNALLFVPLGVLIAERFVRLGFSRWLAMAAILTLAIEAAQVLVLGRSGDVTDVITNTAGAALGFLSVRAMQRRSSLRRPADDLHAN